MVVFENNNEDDMLALTTEDIDEGPGSRWWTRTRYVTVLVSVVACFSTNYVESEF